MCFKNILGRSWFDRVISVKKKRSFKIGSVYGGLFSFRYFKFFGLGGGI